MLGTLITILLEGCKLQENLLFIFPFSSCLQRELLSYINSKGDILLLYLRRESLWFHVYSFIYFNSAGQNTWPWSSLNCRSRTQRMFLKISASLLEAQNHSCLCWCSDFFITQICPKPRSALDSKARQLFCVGPIKEKDQTPSIFSYTIIMETYRFISELTGVVCDLNLE